MLICVRVCHGVHVKSEDNFVEVSFLPLLPAEPSLKHFYFVFTYVVLYACVFVCVYDVCAPHECLVHSKEESEEGIRVSGIGVTDVCQPPCECWDLNSGPLQKQVPLTFKPSW